MNNHQLIYYFINITPLLFKVYDLILIKFLNIFILLLKVLHHHLFTISWLEIHVFYHHLPLPFNLLIILNYFLQFFYHIFLFVFIIIPIPFFFILVFNDFILVLNDFILIFLLFIFKVIQVIFIIIIIFYFYLFLM